MNIELGSNKHLGQLCCNEIRTYVVQCAFKATNYGFWERVHIYSIHDKDPPIQYWRHIGFKCPFCKEELKSRG